MEVDRIYSIEDVLMIDYTFNVNELLTLTGNVSEKILVKRLFRLLEKKIDSFSVENDYHFLLKIFPYLSQLFLDGSSNVITSERLKTLHVKIHNLLTQDDIKKSNNYGILKDLISCLEDLSVSNFYNLFNKYQGNQYSLVHYLIFELKNIFYIKETFSCFPYIVNTIDQDNVPLLKRVINEYYLAIRKNSHDELFYYDMVLANIFNSLQLEYLTEDRKKDLLELKEEYNQKLNSEQLFWLNKLQNRLLEHEQKKSLNDICWQYNIKKNFEQAIYDEIRRNSNYVNKNNRLWLNENIITIDGKNANEIDDGLSIRKLDNGNYLLGVHISNVTGVIPYESLTIKTALTRGSSIYLSNNTIPFLPKYLSQCELSLLKEKERLANSYFFEIAPSGEIVAKKILKTIIKVNDHLTYDDVNNILKNDTNDLNEVSLLAKISSFISQSFDVMKVYNSFKLNDCQNLESSEKIVMYCMLLVGNQVANYASEKGYPILKRVHQVNNTDNLILEKFIVDCKRFTTESNINRLLNTIFKTSPEAYYALDGRHIGLGLDNYAQITSPLRRGCDIVNEHCLDVWHFNKPSNFELYKLEEEVKNRGKQLNKRMLEIEQFSREYENNLREC